VRPSCHGSVPPLCNVATVDSILLLTNVQAGSADDEKLDAAVAVLRASATVELYVSSGPDEIDDMLDRLGHRRLVVAGGDGSLHGVVAALSRRNELKQTVLGLIPIGTGNDFARAVGIPLDPEAAARAVLGEVFAQSTWCLMTPGMSWSTTFGLVSVRKPAAKRANGRSGWAASAMQLARCTRHCGRRLFSY
jgi:hypothetical protein